LKDHPVIAIAVGFVAATMVLSAVFEQLSERERDRRRGRR
jgi:hypothetical protein